MNTAKLLLKINNELGEAPVWNEENECLYFVDILGKTLNKYHIEGDELTSYHFLEYVSCFAFGDDALIYLFQNSGLYSFDEKTDQVKFISKPEDLDLNHRFNDGKCDPYGRFYVGSMENDYKNPTGSLYFVDETLSFTMVEEKAFIVPNGLSWDRKLKKFYHADTINNDINAYDYNPETGAINNKETIIHFEEGQGNPDGMVIDSEGMLWIAHWDAYKVARWNPISGEIIEEIQIPCERPTSMVFGGHDLKTLYITTASLEEAKGEHAGSIFKASVSVPGTKLYKFKTK